MFIILGNYKPFIEKFKKQTSAYTVIENFHEVEKFIADSKNEEFILINPYISLNNNLYSICMEKFKSYDSFYIFNCLGFKKSVFNGGCCSAKTIGHYITSVKNNIRQIDIKNNIKTESYEEKTYSIILPFMFNGDRFPLFIASLDSILHLIKNNNNWELCIHETGPKQHLNNYFFADYQDYNIKYKYTKYDRIFHRAWALNVGVKYLANNNYLILGDSDLLYTQEWFNSIQKIKEPCAGWEKCNMLTKDATEYYLRHKTIKSDFVETHCPHKANDAGKITFIPKKVFYEICGVPEHFKDTYGGEDNALAAKLEAFGYIFHGIKNATIYHLYHEHKTVCNINITKQAHDMLWKWDKNRWLEENKKEWGKITYPKTNINKPIKILWCKHNRTGIINKHLLDSLQTEMQNYFNIKFVENFIPKNMTLGQYNANVFSDNSICRKVNVKNMFEKDPFNVLIADTPSLFASEDFKCIDCLKIGLIEDLQGSKDIYNFLKNQKFDVILNRYKYSIKNVLPELSTFPGKLFWLPHAINTDFFTYKNIEKKYDVILLGETYKNIYPLRSLAIEKLSKYSWFKHFPRPKDHSKNPFPVGKDYIKLLNESKIGITDGSIYKYPIMKYMEFPACGSLLYAEYFPELKELGFIPEKNMVKYNSTKLEIDLQQWLKNDKDREYIVKNGIEHIKKYHSIQYRAKELCNIICISLGCDLKFPEMDLNNYTYK